MRRSVTPCLDCGIPVRATRCSQCSEKRLETFQPKPKSNTTSRGYGADWQKVRRWILDRDKWICYRCGKKLSGNDATVDHIVPLSVDPAQRLNPQNLAACCRSCNSRKSDKK